MTAGLLERVLVPVANESDTEATCDALEPYLDEMDEVFLAHIVEQTAGYMDHAPPDVLEADARGFLELALQRLGEEAVVDVHVRFGEDVVEELVAMAIEQEATAIAFHPRKRGLLSRLVEGTHEGELVRASPVPVLSLPSPDRS